MIEQITVLGSTGSIGKSTLDVVSRHPDRYRVFAVSANRNVAELLIQCETFHPVYAVMADVESADKLKAQLEQSSCKTEVLAGIEGLSLIASHDEVDIVVAAIVGAAGLVPTLSAASSGKKLLLANKESLVMSGALFMDMVDKNSGVLLPVDSEHNAIFQCLPGDRHIDQSSIEKIILTASGGPFRSLDMSELEHVTPEQAVAHPNWDMGKKISVDSATMMNKGLEVIEAVWMFGIEAGRVEVVIHPQSIIHSMVSYVDGSVLAQLGNPDMRTPIAHALAWPDRISAGVEPLDLFNVGSLEFEKPDLAKFPCLRLCYESIQLGGTASIILNAANEIAVEAFLSREIRFTQIAEVVEQTMNESSINPDVSTLDSILEADKNARTISRRLITHYHQNS